jgi:hypothetical protein
MSCSILGDLRNKQRVRKCNIIVLVRYRSLTNDPSHKGDAFIMSKFGDKAYKYSLAAIKSIPKQLYK